MRHALRVIVALAAMVVGTTGVMTAVPAAAATVTTNGVTLNGYEAALANDINAVRAAHGLHRLTVVPGASDVARRWAWHLAGAQALSHNPSLVYDLEHSGSSAWTEIAENVGMASATDPTALFDAYMNSAPHRANILDATVRYLGVGTVERSGVAWNTLDFVNAYSTSYGRTRVPPAGLTIDTVAVRTSTTLASFESPDERAGSAGHGYVHASLVHFTAPTTGNDRAVVTFHRVGSGGYADLVLRDALDLHQATAVAVQVAVSTANGAPLSVQVLASRAFGSTVSLGTISVRHTGQWFTLTLPSSARTWRDTLTLRATNAAVRSAGGQATLSLYTVTAKV